MGCDYYTWLETVIQWKDTSGNIRTYVDKPEFEDYDRHYSYSGGDYDPDFDKPPSIHEELNQIIWSYGTKSMYLNGEWKCREVGKRRILEILENQKIPLNSVTEVFKKMDGYVR